MKVKSGDKVKIISGKDRGKSGKVLRAFPRKDLVIVEGMGVVKKHQKPKKSGDKGQIIDIPTPIHVSNVSLDGGVKSKKK